MENVKTSSGSSLYRLVGALILGLILFFTLITSFKTSVFEVFLSFISPSAGVDPSVSISEITLVYIIYGSILSVVIGFVVKYVLGDSSFKPISYFTLAYAAMFYFFWHEFDELESMTIVMFFVFVFLLILFFMVGAAVGKILYIKFRKTSAALFIIMLSIFLILFGIFLYEFYWQNNWQGNGIDFIENQLFIKFENNISFDEAKVLVNQYGGWIIEGIYRWDASGIAHFPEIDTKEGLLNLSESLETNEIVDYAGLRIIDQPF